MVNPRIPKKILRWRAKQPHHSIMSATTFRRIARRSGGGKRGQAIAGAAYWRTVRARYKASHRNPGAGWHAQEARDAFRAMEGERDPAIKSFMAGQYEAHDYSARKSRRYGLNPRRHTRSLGGDVGSAVGMVVILAAVIWGIGMMGIRSVWTV